MSHPVITRATERPDSPSSARHPAWVAARFLSTQPLGPLTTLALCARRGCRRRQDRGVAAVAKLVLAPTRCPRGHALRPDRTLLRTVSCSCGQHTTWRCHCGEVIYRPALAEHCRLLNGRAGTMTSWPTRRRSAPATCRYCCP